MWVESIYSPFYVWTISSVEKNFQVKTAVEPDHRVFPSLMRWTVTTKTVNKNQQKFINSTERRKGCSLMSLVCDRPPPTKKKESKKISGMVLKSVSHWILTGPRKQVNKFLVLPINLTEEISAGVCWVRDCSQLGLGWGGVLLTSILLEH